MSEKKSFGNCNNQYIKKIQLNLTLDPEKNLHFIL